MHLPKADNFSDRALLGLAKCSWRKRWAVRARPGQPLSGRVRPRVAEAGRKRSNEVRGSGPPGRARAFGCWDQTLDCKPCEEEGLWLIQSERRIRAPSITLATGRGGWSCRSGGLGPALVALVNRTMSRPKVGVPPTPDAFLVLREGGRPRRHSDLGGLREMILDRVGGKR